MPKILIPTPLRQYTEKQSAVEVDGETVEQVLRALTTQFPGLRPQLYSDAGVLRSYVNVYVNDEDIRYLEKQATPVAAGDTLTIVPSIAGGSVVADAPATTVPANATELTNEEILRYSRHLIMPEVGVDGQLKLKNASVLLVGAGGLGAPLGLYLAAAGIGRIGLVDFDVVDHTNLHRQVIHGTKDVGRKKLDSAADRMRDINPNVELELHDVALTSENALDLLTGYDLIIDGTDNFPTRYLVNDACVLLKKPNVYGSIFRFEGQATVFAYPGGPCYRCSYPEPPPPGLVPSCAEGGVLGILPGIIGLIQATEAVKLILGIGEPLVGRLLRYDALEMRFREYKVRRDRDCPVCGDHPTITALIDYQEFCGIPQQVANEPLKSELDVTEVKRKIDDGDDFLLLDVREPHEYQIARIETAKLIPLGELERRIGELDPGSSIVVHCKSGGRSAKAVELLKQRGFKDVANMRGGILAWSDKVDSRVPKY